MEIWKNITRYPEYQVSNLGNIRSKDSVDVKNRVRKGVILKPQQDKFGYIRYRISVKNTKYTIRCHRIVAEEFIENPQNKEQVNHKDGDKTNNNVTNLEWVTPSENIQHAVDTGLSIYDTGKTARRFDSAVLVYDINMNYLYSLSGNKEITDKGFCYKLVSAVVNNKRNSHKGHIFKRYLIPTLET